MSFHLLTTGLLLNYLLSLFFHHNLLTFAPSFLCCDCVHFYSPCLFSVLFVSCYYLIYTPKKMNSPHEEPNY